MNKVRCLVCDASMAGDPSEWPDRPFCSKRCRIIDLGRWLGEDYRIAGKPVTDSPDTDAEE